MASCKARVRVSNSRDWSSLPSDVLVIISGKSIYKEQYSSMRLVCKDWHHACCAAHLPHLIGQVPWLFVRNTRNITSSTFTFYNIGQSEMHKFVWPDAVGKKVCSGSRSWLLLEKDGEFSLSNPITGELKTNCVPPRPYGIICLPASLYKFILTSSPSDEGCIVVAQFYMGWDLVFSRIGDDSWTVLKKGYNNIFDLKYRNGLVYAMHKQGKFTIYDLGDLSEKVLVGDLNCKCGWNDLYLVIGEGELDGVPLLVRRVFLGRDSFEVYRCIETKVQPRWSRVRDIGNSVLLLGHEAFGRYYKLKTECAIVSLDHVWLNGLERNSVCYYPEMCDSSGETYVDVVRMVSIEDESVKEVPTSLGRVDSVGFSLTLFTPSLR